jgi:HEAT repeat protein
MYIAIAILVILWLVAMACRNQIRAQFWAYRLRNTEDLTVQTQYLARLASLGNAAIPAARSLLADGNPTVRSQGLVILNHAPDPAATELILLATRDPDEWMRESAVRGLAARNDVDALISILKRDDATTAGAAADALASMRIERAIPVLIEQLDPARPTAIRVEVIQALARMKAAQAIPALQNCLEDQTSFDGLTVSEKSAHNAVAEMSPHADVTWPSDRTIADFAARALAEIESETAGPPQE